MAQIVIIITIVMSQQQSEIYILPLANPTKLTLQSSNDQVMLCKAAPLGL